MGRKMKARSAMTAPTSSSTEKEVSHLTLRLLENLYVHSDTLQCVLKHRCVPCGYKLILHARPGLLPNQRPEMCPRIKAQTKNDPHGKTTDSTTTCSIGLYDETQIQRLLTVGDGNFSFSLALARAFAHAKTHRVELVVTSHESRASVVETYPDGEAILQELAAMDHVTVHHEIDATDAKQMALLGTFDRVLWNFPCVRVPRGKDGQNEEMELNKALLDGFFKHVASRLTPTGEIHVTHKTKPPFSQWGMEDIAARNGLCHAQSVVFDRCLYPGYSNKKVLSKGSFPIWDSQTFVFVPQSREKKQPQNVKALQPMTKELLAKAYMILTPTYQEKLDQEERLRRMQQKREDASSKKESTMGPNKPSKKEKNSEGTQPTGTKRKQSVTLAHHKSKNHKGKRQRR